MYTSIHIFLVLISCKSLSNAFSRPSLTINRVTVPQINRFSVSFATRNEPDDQTVQDLDLEQMFEVFEAADKEISDVDVKKPEGIKEQSKASANNDDDEIPADQMDIIKRVKPRDDGWSEGPLASPLAGVSKGVEDDPLDNIILNSPLPSGAFLGLATVLAIAFVGCIFQLFYDKPAAPVLGVPLTVAVLAASGPAFILSFIAAIKKGNAETDEDWK